VSDEDSTTYRADFELQTPRKEFFNISKYAGPVKVFGVVNFMILAHTNHDSAVALCPFDRVARFVP
jgi:hypothetical protein